MADTTPKLNSLAVNLRILLDDIVDGADNGIKAETDGDKFTANKINQYLLEAMRELPKRLVDNYGVGMAADLSPGLIKTQDIVFSANGVDTNKDLVYPLGMVEVEVESA
jgi:hypothetical protein